MKGFVLILSGPSGSGKSSLSNMLFKELDNYYFSISTTTREPRKNEIDGKDYFFTSKEQFEKEIQENSFLEYAKIYDNYYGTSSIPIKKAIDENKLVILDIDVQGREQVVSKIGHLCTSVFITTPFKKTLQERLETRATDSIDIIQKRINHAESEMAYMKNYDYLLVNQDLDKTFKNLMNIISSTSLKIDSKKIYKFIAKWTEGEK